MELDPQEVALLVVRGYCHRAFIRTSQAWYRESAMRGRNTIEDMSIGFYFPHDGGTYGEFTMKWEKLGRNVCAQMKMWDDFWHLTPLFQDFFTMMGRHTTSSDEDSITPGAFAEELLKLGFVDHTPRESGDKPPEPDYASQRLHATIPVRVPEAFHHLFEHRFVVPFSGTTTFDKGVLVKNPEISAFVEQNCQNGYRCFKNDVLLNSEEDAMLVHMRFS